MKQQTFLWVVMGSIVHLALVGLHAAFAAPDLQTGVSELDGRITAFGQFLAEELITRLFVESPGRFEVVERRQLVRVLAGQRLTMSGLLDAKAMESVDKILGIDVIVILVIHQT